MHFDTGDRNEGCTFRFCTLDFYGISMFMFYEFMSGVLSDFVLLILCVFLCLCYVHLYELPT